MEVVSTLKDVRSFETRGGNARFVARDADDNEYTTFREEIGHRARELQGRRVRFSFHRTRRGNYENVYLDGVEPVETEGGGERDTDVEEAAWRTAVAAAPWLVGEPNKAVAPDKLYDKLKPFEDRVAEDIERKRDS